jgi:hypothetical protein
MDEMVCVFGDTVLRLDQSVIELFKQVVVGSQRTPLIWAGADLKPSKGDQIQVNVGTSRGDGFYNSDIISNGAFKFKIAASDEPRLRAFLDEAARRAGQAAAGN